MIKRRTCLNPVRDITYCKISSSRPVFFFCQGTIIGLLNVCFLEERPKRNLPLFFHSFKCGPRQGHSTSSALICSDETNETFLWNNCCALTMCIFNYRYPSVTLLTWILQVRRVTMLRLNCGFWPCYVVCEEKRRQKHCDQW